MLKFVARWQLRVRETTHLWSPFGASSKGEVGGHRVASFFSLVLVSRGDSGTNFSNILLPVRRNVYVFPIYYIYILW